MPWSLAGSQCVLRSTRREWRQGETFLIMKLVLPLYLLYAMITPPHPTLAGGVSQFITSQAR